MSDLAVSKPAMGRTGPKWFKRWFNPEARVAYLFILPSLIGFVTFYAVPAVRGLLISFSNWDMLTTPKYVGLANYQAMIQDREFWNSLWVTVTYVLLNIPIQTILAIGLAAMMDRVTKSSLIRGLFVMPWLLPPVIVALVWLWMLDPALGFVNNLLRTVGLPAQSFLGSPQQAMASIAGINIWQYTGYTALLFFAGLQTIPKEIYEAGAIDGASEGRMFWSITLPLLRPVLVFVLVTSIIGSFQVFDTIAVTTKGGPVNATKVITWYIYEFAFNRFQMGYATTLAVALFIILVVATIIQMRILNAGSSDLA